MQITPAILPHSYQEIREKMEKISAVATRVQIDLCDGRVGREITWMPEGMEHLPYIDTIDYEFDLMVNDWRAVLEKVLMVHARRIVIHIDSFSEDDCKELALFCKKIQIPLGLAVSNDFEVTQFIDMVHIVKKYYENIFIQVMGIKKIGEQGQFFDESCIARIMQIKQVFVDVELQVDGAMRPETIPRVKEAGATGVVVGSYLMRHDDMAQAYSELSCIE